MKKKLLSLVLITGLTLVNAQNVITDDAPKTEESTNVTIDFVSKVVDYGTIDHNADGARKFVFTNNGTDDLLIKNAKGSCGCTVPTWPREAIAPGDSGSFSVKFNSRGKKNVTQQTVTITANTEKGSERVKIKAMVEVPEGAATPVVAKQPLAIPAKQ